MLRRIVFAVNAGLQVNGWGRRCE